MSNETIVAAATPPGRGGVAVVRVSGPLVEKISLAIMGKALLPRQAIFGKFRDVNDSYLDEGLALFFKGPRSFTGEDVLELQGHGSPMVVDLLIQRIINLGARMARPGEFSERAFLNGKLDLAQAEAIADLIDSVSAQAARSAFRSLQGEFSARITLLLNELLELRLFVEAAIDFPDEEIDFLSSGNIAERLSQAQKKLKQVLTAAKQGVLLRDGVTLVIAGRPNVGKSSLLNVLSGTQTAIVTDIAGTTRDVLHQYIQIDGLPIKIIDTAGLRSTSDVVESEGIKRAVNEIKNADHVLLLVDAAHTFSLTEEIEYLYQSCNNYLTNDEILANKQMKVSVVVNKIDLVNESPHVEVLGTVPHIFISAKKQEGIDALRSHIKQSVGYIGAEESTIIARRRHLSALELTGEHLINAEQQMKNCSFELLAEELRLAHLALSEITGQFTSDDLLGKIFSSFCIGK